MASAPKFKSLRTDAPVLNETPRFIPTGNLSVSLAEISIDDGAVRSLGVLHERAAGLVQAEGGGNGERLIQPVLIVEGEQVPLGEMKWTREGCWLPHFEAEVPSGTLEGWYCAPIGERGLALRLRYRHRAADAVTVELGWEGWWHTTSLAQLRSEQLHGDRVGHDDAWTGSRVVAMTAGLPLLAVAWQAGDGAELLADGIAATWRATKGEAVAVSEALTMDLFVGVAPESDGAATTALHLRRRGFEALFETTMTWLAQHSLAVPGEQAVLRERLNTHLFFNFFFAQGDCLDTGAAVMVTSRSPQYYVCAAFWSRDAYCWSFPALLLTDTRRARQVLVASLESGGPRLADHALYLNGTSLYPGFELDQAAAPVLAVWRYVTATGDFDVLSERGVAAVLAGLTELVAPWRHPDWELYGTFLLPTDDPTDHPYVTTCNALLAAAFDALARLVRGAEARGIKIAADASWKLRADDFEARASAIRAALRAHLVVDGPYGPMWAWACDATGRTELREEPPLGLRTLAFFEVGETNDAIQLATRAWLRTHYRHHYGGNYPGAGSDHFPFPSGFDLASRLLDGDDNDGNPLRQLVETPMDQGLGCESFDPATGVVRTGAAMASMSGLLVWTAVVHLAGQRRMTDG